MTTTTPPLLTIIILSHLLSHLRNFLNKPKTKPKPKPTTTPTPTPTPTPNNHQQKKTNGETPVFMASWRDQFEAVRVLHEFHALLLCPKVYFLFLFSSFLRWFSPNLIVCFFFLLLLFFFSSSPLRQSGKSLLHLAAWRNKPDLAALLVELGVDIDMRDMVCFLFCFVLFCFVLF